MLSIEHLLAYVSSIKSSHSFVKRKASRQVNQAEITQFPSVGISTPFSCCDSRRLGQSNVSLRLTECSCWIVPTLNFFSRESTKKYRRSFSKLLSFFRYNYCLYSSTKNSEIWIFCAILCDEDGLTSKSMTWVCLNLTRFCFSVPYAPYIKNDDKKRLEKVLPTYPTLFEDLAPNRYIFWPVSIIRLSSFLIFLYTASSFREQ